MLTWANVYSMRHWMVWAYVSILFASYFILESEIKRMSQFHVFVCNNIYLPKIRGTKHDLTTMVNNKYRNI